MKKLLLTILFLSAISVCFAGNLSPHFSSHEFECRCCGEMNISTALIYALEVLRHYIGDTPITVTSGYRCKSHNKSVCGVSNSQHILGTAADIKVKFTAEFTIDDLYQACRYIDRFSFIKKYNYEDEEGNWIRFIHVDVRS